MTKPQRRTDPTRKIQPQNKAPNLRGQKFGALTVLNQVPSTDRGLSQWRCKCACGNETVAGGPYLRNGRTKNCGCGRTS